MMAGQEILEEDGTWGAERYEEFYESSSMTARENAYTLAQLFVDYQKEDGHHHHHGDNATICRNRTAELAFDGVELSEWGFNQSYTTQAQMEAISWLGDNEVMILGDIIVSRISPTVHPECEALLGRALPATGCNGVFSATCANYQHVDTSYRTFIHHYTSNGGTPTAGWDKYTQLVYSLDLLQWHRVWAKCESTYWSRKKELFFRHGPLPFRKRQQTKSEVWLKKQAICCGYGSCSLFTD
jgi:hypothetical protein